MRYLITLLFAALSLNAVGQTNPNYNPDYDADGFINVNDLFGFLAAYGNTWDSEDVISGCTYSYAVEYNPLANDDDGSCIFLPDCAGVINGCSLIDECGTCDSDPSNDCVQDCNGDWGGIASLDECGVCDGNNSTCLDECGVPNGDNTTCAGCDGIPNSGLVIDECGVCDGNNSTCLDECGVPNGDNSSCTDECGVPNGDNTTCAGCDGIPNSGLVIDECGVCDGNNSTCLDECGVPNGDNSSCTDECGVPNGDNTTCAGCDGIPNSGLLIDECGICDGNNSTCLDECGVPNGDNSSCTDECGVPNGDNSSCTDECGVPNGDNTTCAGCMDAGACNYDDTATIDAGCEYETCAGCMDPIACDYDPSATIQAYGEFEGATGLSFSWTPGSLDSEVSWDIGYDGGTYSGVAGSEPTLYIAEGTFTICGYDSSGDGWNGGELVITDNASGNSVSLAVEGDQTCVEITVTGPPALCEYESCAGCDGIANYTINHDGYDYPTIQIGDQCWFSENCRYLPSVSPSSASSTTDPYFYVYDYQGTDVTLAKTTANYDTYGVLYNWPAFMTADICPSGWHIPSDGEWQTMEVSLGMSIADASSIGWRGSPVGDYMKSTSGWDTIWDINGNGSNSSGFSALPGGTSWGGDFHTVGYAGSWWSSSEFELPLSWHRELAYASDTVVRGNVNRHNGGYARCVRD